MYRIEKEFAFEAAHSLPHLPEGHKCRRPHGHSYRVRVMLESRSLNADGFVQDYADLSGVGDFILRHWDHQNLNDLSLARLAPQTTSAEMLAFWLFHRFKPDFPALVEVAVSETAKTWASYFTDERPPEHRSVITPTHAHGYRP